MPLIFRAVCLALACPAVAPPEPPVPFPHPLITELLYAVPSGEKGDASADGVRDAVGDEFVELVNPHDRPINLKGYTITDGTPDDPSTPAKQPKSGAPGGAVGGDHDDPDGAAHKQVRFTFPALELQPGQVAVVFNGHRQKIKGPVGGAHRPPAAANENFFGAFVFSMQNESQYVAFSNTADCVILWDPEGRPIEAIHWRHTAKAPKDQPARPSAPARSAPRSDKGKDKPATQEIAPGPASDRAVPPPGTLLVEEAPESRGSVARVGLTKRLVAHTDLSGAHGALFSPGKFDPTGVGEGDPPGEHGSPK